MKFTLNENGVLSRVIDWNTVHCMDAHGMLSDKCTMGVDNLGQLTKEMITLDPHYFQENNAAIIHIVHATLQTLVNGIKTLGPTPLGGLTDFIHLFI